MYTLWDKLKPEYKKVISSESNKATKPHVADLVGKLRLSNFWPELTVMDVMSIVSMCDIPTYKVHTYMWKFGEDILCDD